AYPHDTRDPIVAGSAIVNALQQVASRNVGPLDSVVVSVTQFHGGTAHNIIPGEVKLGGTARTLLPETQELAQQRIKEIASHLARAQGCEAAVTYTIGYPVTRNDATAVSVVNAVAAQLLGKDNVPPLEQPVMGGEDF